MLTSLELILSKLKVNKKKKRVLDNSYLLMPWVVIGHV